MLKINEELRELIPALSTEEKQLLTESILKEGCRDSLITWNNTIIDGHNRYEICKANNIAFSTKEMEFENVEQVKEWMINNQFSRRNLPLYQRAVLALKLKPIYEERAREKQLSTLKQNTDAVKENSPEREKPIETREELAKQAGVSSNTISRVEKIQEKAPIETKQKLASGEISINQAYKEIKNIEKKIEFEQKIEDIRTTAVEMPTGKYQCIVLDPPWSYGTKFSATGRRVANPYPEMSQEELKELEILSEDDSVMFLWTTQRFIWDAKELLEHWGFNYRSMIVWDKEQMGMGDLLRMQCEFCLIGIKGKPLLNNPNNIRDIIREPRREHSRKPEAFYEIVNTLCVGSKIEYFSRTEREGWKSFGNETDKF